MSPRDPYRRHSMQFKLQLCQDIRRGVIGRRNAQCTYRVSANLIQLRLSQFDRGELNQEEAEASVVAEYLTFRHAANPLRVSKSSVSARVKTLEEDLGILLFERHACGVRLTAAGRHFVERMTTRHRPARPRSHERQDGGTGRVYRPSTTCSARDCDLCLRYKLLPMSPGRTFERWRAGHNITANFYLVEIKR